MAYTTIAVKQDGSALYPFLSNSAPSSSPGFAAEIHAVLKDQSTGILYVKTSTSDTGWEPITGSQSYKTDEEYYKFRAQYLMGSPRLTCWWWDDFLEPSSENFISGATSATCTWTTKNDPCGISTLTVPQNATSNSSIQLSTGNTVTPPGNQIPTGSGNWYVACRMKHAGVLTDNTQRAAQFVYLDSDASNASYLLFGAYSSNFWMFQSDVNSAVNSTTTIDGLTHVHELCRVGTTTSYYLDETRIMSGNLRATGSHYLSLQAQNSICTAGATSMHIDYLCYAVGGNDPRTIS